MWGEQIILAHDSPNTLFVSGYAGKPKLGPYLAITLSMKTKLGCLGNDRTYLIQDNGVAQDRLPASP